MSNPPVAVTDLEEAQAVLDTIVREKAEIERQRDTLARELRDLKRERQDARPMIPEGVDIHLMRRVGVFMARVDAEPVFRHAPASLRREHAELHGAVAIYVDAARRDWRPR